MTFDAGKLRHTVTVQRQSETFDQFRERTDEWADIVTVPACVIASSASESWNHDQVEHLITYKVLVRYGVDVRPDDRLVYEQRTLHIVGIVEEHKHLLRLDCKEVQ